jgi:hypothetical protein
MSSVAHASNPITDAMSQLWNQTLKIVRVRQDASTTEKVVRVYNAVVAASVLGGYAYQLIAGDTPSDPLANFVVTFITTGEYLSDVAFHAIQSQISETSPTYVKAAGIALDAIRMNIINDLYFTSPSFSTIPGVLNTFDFFVNHPLNIAYNSGLLQKAITILNSDG